MLHESCFTPGATPLLCAAPGPVWLVRIRNLSFLLHHPSSCFKDCGHVGTREGGGGGPASTEPAQASAGACSGPLAAQLLLRIQSQALGGDQLPSKEQQLRTSRLPSDLVLAAVPRGSSASTESGCLLSMLRLQLPLRGLSTVDISKYEKGIRREWCKMRFGRGNFKVGHDLLPHPSAVKAKQRCTAVDLAILLTR